MNVVSLCPLPAATLVWQPAPSRFSLTVVCKATYQLEPGTAPLAAEQEEISDRESHWDDDANRSLYAPSDLVPFKPRGDIVLVGSAYARSGQLVRSLVVRLNIGAVDKSIEVFCPRLRTRDGEIREGKRWAKMPLLYERAGGGPETANPVGMSREGPRDAYGQVQLPNLQVPGRLSSSNDPIDPIGFGPIAAGWPSRKAKAGRGKPDHDFNRAPFGEGFDHGYFQAAPLDQQVDVIHPNERIILENLHVNHPRLVTSLPDISPRALVEVPGAPGREVSLTADTLWIDTHRAICTVTFRGRVDIERADQEGRILIAMGKGDHKPSWAKLAPAPAAPPTPPVIPPPPPPMSAPPSPVEERISAGKVAVTLVSPGAIPELPRARPHVPSDHETADLLESIEITQSESAPRELDASTLVLGPEGRKPGAKGADGPALPFQPAPPGWQPPASISSGRAPPPPPPSATKGAKLATQKIDMTEFRAALPAWLESTVPSPPAHIPPPPPSVVPSPPPSMVAPPPIVPPPPPVSVLLREGANPSKSVPPPPPTLPKEALSSESFGALAASNAAAAGERDRARPSPEPRPSAPSSAAAVVELLWFDPTLGPRLARHPSFALPKRAPGPEAPDAETPEERIRAHVHDALTRGAPSPGRELEAILEVEEEDNPLTTPLVLVSGDLELCLDETEMLKAIVSAASPLASTDKKLKEAIDLAIELLKTPMQGMPEVAEGLGARIREAWTKVNRLLPVNYIAVCTERLLLEQRLYQKRELLDDTWIRALLGGTGLEAPIPTYVPAKIARRLPLFKRFHARLIVELLWQQDQYETHPLALRALALGRVSTRARARSLRAAKRR